MKFNGRDRAAIACYHGTVDNSANSSRITRFDTTVAVGTWRDKLIRLSRHRHDTGEDTCSRFGGDQREVSKAWRFPLIEKSVIR